MLGLMRKLNRDTGNETSVGPPGSGVYGSSNSEQFCCFIKISNSVNQSRMMS